MANREANMIHNVAFIGHGSSGKTTLVEALLHKAGAISRRGSVTDGTSIGLIDPEEKERRITVNCNLFHCEWDGRHLQLIDTPGYADFVGGLLSALAAADVAVLCVNATAGIEVNTRKAWDRAQAAGLPMAIAITRMDGDNADFQGVLASIRETFSTAALPLYLPDGMGKGFGAVIPVLSPPQGNSEAEAAREQLMECVVEADDELLERYLDGEEISGEEFTRAFVAAVQSGTVIPVAPCAAEEDIGVEEWLKTIVECLPSAAARGVAGQTPSGEEAARRAEPGEPFCARVFRVKTDRFVGKLSYFRVFSGTYSADQALYNARTGKKTKIGGLFRVQGAEQEPISEVGPGDIAAVSKVEDIAVSDTLCAESDPIILEPIEFPMPMVSLAVEPKARGDEQKISGALAQLAQEDPTFKSMRDTQTKELIISAVGTLHLDVMLERMKNRFDLEVTTKEPMIPYRETITAKSEAHYRHKKQTGGRGQFGEVYIRMEPNERGAGFEFINSIVGGAIPNQFIPAVEKGIREAMNSSAFAGFPAVDLKVELYFGSFHSVDSDEFSFKTAAREAYKIGFLEAKPVLLEPIVNLEVSVPSRFMGDITSDLNRRRGRITGMDSLGNIQVIKAQVPLAEIANYSTELRSITQGEGDYSIEPSHYDIVPAHIAQQIVAKYKKGREEG